MGRAARKAREILRGRFLRGNRLEAEAILCVLLPAVTVGLTLLYLRLYEVLVLLIKRNSGKN
jgi:hypothetical protein